MKIISLSIVMLFAFISFKSFASEPENNKEIEETLQFEPALIDEISELEENLEYKFEKIERDIDFDSHKLELDRIHKKAEELSLRAARAKRLMKKLYEQIEAVNNELSDIYWPPFELVDSEGLTEVKELQEKLNSPFIIRQSNDSLVDTFTGPLKDVMQEIENSVQLKVEEQTPVESQVDTN